MSKILVFLLVVASFGYGSLKEGIYELEGYNPGSNTRNYGGNVHITSNGENYEVVWLIGATQSQYGIGILQGDVLSVSYFDLSGNDKGVVSFRVISDTELEGKWASVCSEVYGVEKLRFISNPLE